MSLEDFRPMMERCSNCLNCRWIPYDKVQSIRFGENCPSVGYHNFNSYTARGRFQMAQSMLDGRTDYTDTVVDIIHNCMSCGACDVACKICRYNLEPLEHNIELKNKAIEDKQILPKHQEMLDNLKKEKTMIPGRVKNDRMVWTKGLTVKNVLKEKAEVLFFAGCKYTYNKKYHKNLQGTVNILLEAGVDLGVMGSADNCCAGRSYQMGFRREFEEIAETNIKALEKSGVKTIVTPCSDCYYTFKKLYAQKGLKIKVLHIVEYIYQLIKEDKIKFSKSVPVTVTYHDPCHLGRLGEPYVAWEGREKKIFNQIHTWEPRRPRYAGTYGIYNEPREIIKSIPGVTLVEMERIREYSWCCGAGGGCSETNPEFSQWTAEERITEANSTGADMCITACPWCQDNLENVEDNGGRKIKVLDIIELVQKAL